MIKLGNVVPASPEQMAFIIQGMRNPMTVEAAYDYLKTLPEFSGAEDI